MKRTQRWKAGAVVIMALCILAFASIGAFASAQWTNPTQPMDVDDNVITIAAHGAAEPLPGYLGANLITARPLLKGDTPEALFAAALEKEFLGIFGSEANANPDPYIWNYFYNKYAAVNGLPITEDAILDILSGSPMGADTTIVPEYGTSASLYVRPDILLGINAAKDGTNYDVLLADLPENKDSDPNNDYKPIMIAYDPSNLANTIKTVHNVAAAMEDLMAETGKTTRYGDPSTIAVDYENFIRGIQFYILSQLEEKNIEKKTIAVISPTDLGDGTFNAYTSALSSGTAASVRGCEYTELTTNNIVDVLGLEQQEGVYKIKAAQLLECDVIFIYGAQGGSMTTDDFITMLTDKYKVDAQKLMQIPIYSTPPGNAFGIIMNSVENALGLAMFQGFQYYAETGFNPVYAAAYYYEKFYHITDPTAIANTVAANLGAASLPAGVTTSLSAYDKAAFEEMLVEGMEYYQAHEKEYVGTKWEWDLNYTTGIGTNIDSEVSQFTDLVDHWAVSEISALVARGMFNGMSPTTFEPDTTMTKEMILTVLYRYEGKPAIGANPFKDLAADEWCTDGVCWAVENKLIKGRTTTSFGRNTTITREELASVLFNYAKLKGLSITDRSNLATYVDKSSIEAKNMEAVQWAVGNGIINGRTATTIVPDGTATRAEVVTMIYRFLDILEK